MTRSKPRWLLGLALILALLLGSSLPTSAQNDGPPFVTITRVDSDNFPQVKVYTAATDESGLPLVGLTENNFWIEEDGSRVTTWDVAGDTGQPLYLVLAVDLSMRQVYLSKAKEALKFFIDTLGSQDRVAVIAFYNEIDVVQAEFTNNKTVLKAAIDKLTLAGDRTSLNKAAFEAVSMTESFSEGRRAVIMVTNIVDNASDLSSQEVIAKALEVQTPIYTVGIGADAKSDVHHGLTWKTGGHSFLVSTPNDVRLAFQRIGVLLRQGYVVAFQSELQADDAEHALALGVAYEGGEGQAEGRFVAVPGSVDVALLGLTDGQMLAGQVSLTSIVTATTSSVAVEYLLDDQSLATVSRPPYRFDWDTATVDPVAYTLTARAVDKVGNEGRAEVHISIAPPPIVTASLARQEIQVGDPITVEASVETPVEVGRVEFLWDKTWIGIDETEPYNFVFGSQDHASGEHTILVRAIDSLGQEDETQVVVRLLPVPKSKSIFELISALNWKDITGIIAGIALGLAIVVTTALLLVVGARRRNRPIRYPLEIHNAGNVQCRYKLLAEEPSGILKFQFALNGTNLHERIVTETVSVPQQGVQTKAVRQQAPRKDAVSASQAPPASKGPSGAKQAVSTAKGLSGFVVEAISTLAAFLPGSAGAALRSTSGQMRRGQGTVTRVERLSGRASKMKPKSVGTSAIPQVQSQPAMPALAGAPAGAPATLASESLVPVEQEITRTVIDTWAQTPPIPPGEKLLLDLLVQPTKSLYKTRSFAFTMKSKAIERESDVVTTVGNIKVAGISWFRRHLLPFVVFLAVSAAVVWAVIFLLENTGFLG
jgi:VWFA-related protein